MNEFGVEEAGIDGGGIFKDFMENITRAAFDVQYGLFKVTFVFCYCLCFIFVKDIKTIHDHLPKILSF